MQSSVQRLEVTGSALRDALNSQNWAAIGELDLRCRQEIEAAMSDLADEQRLRGSMENLLALYRDMVAVCQAEQGRLASELMQLNQSRSGAKIYQLFG